MYPLECIAAVTVAVAAAAFSTIIPRINRVPVHVYSFFPLRSLLYRFDSLTLFLSLAIFLLSCCFFFSHWIFCFFDFHRIFFFFSFCSTIYKINICIFLCDDFHFKSLHDIDSIDSDHFWWIRKCISHSVFRCLVIIELFDWNVGKKIFRERERETV